MNAEMPVKNVPFKICSICNNVWNTRDDFLGDPDIHIVGYQPHFEALVEGLFLFNHSCLGTLSISAGRFASLYDGPVFTERLTGSVDCPGYCLHKNELRPCAAKCECAFVREIIQVILNWQKMERTAKFTEDRHE